jgi:hypothetical protein
LTERGEKFHRARVEFRRKTKPKSEAIERDAGKLRVLRDHSLAADTVDPDGAGTIPTVIAQVRRQREQITTAAAPTESLEQRVARLEATQAGR